MGQAAAMATAMAIAAVAKQGPCAATVEAAGPDRLWTPNAQVLLATEVAEATAEVAAAAVAVAEEAAEAGAEVVVDTAAEAERSQWKGGAGPG